MNCLNHGEVFKFRHDIKKYVFLERTFEEWYNTGGMGEYTYHYLPLCMVEMLTTNEDSEELGRYIQHSKDSNFLKNVESCEDEAPFEISSRKVILYKVRRKQPKTIVVYE